MIVNGYANGIRQDLKVEVSKIRDLQTIELTLPDGSFYTGEGSNLFEALNQVRNKLEPTGWMVGVAASRLNASAPPVDDDYRVDQVVLKDSDGYTTLVNAMQPASYESVASIRRQQEYNQNVNRIIAGNIQKEQEELGKNEEVIEIRRETPRPTIGIVHAFASYILTGIILFIIVPLQEPVILIGAFLFALIYGAYAIVHCVADIAYSISRPSQYGLFFLLLQPIIWFLLFFVLAYLSQGSNSSDMSTVTDLQQFYKNL